MSTNTKKVAGQAAVSSETAGKEKKEVVFLPIRNNIHRVRVTGPCEIDFTEIVKYDPDQKGVILDSYHKVEIFKGLKDDRVPALRYILGKKKENSRSWGMQVEFTEEDKAQEV